MVPELLLMMSMCAPQVHPSTMAALVHHESGANPYAIGINKGSRLAKQPTNRADAIRIVKDLIEEGIDFDAGLGQINVRNWGWLKLSPETVFDPCANLGAAQTVLTDCYLRAAGSHQPGQHALQAALSCYNTGNFRAGMKNGYVGRVYASAGRVVPQIGNTPAKASPPEKSKPKKEGGLQNPTPDGFDTPSSDGFTPSE